MKFMILLRPLCEILGRSIGAQLSRIKRDVIMAEHLHTLRPKIVGKNGAAQVRDTACLAIQRLDYFMGGIDHERVSPERRDAVIKYKKEFANAIYAYFQTKRLPGDVLAELDAALPLKTQAFHQKMDEAAALHGELIAEDDKRISGLDKRVADLEARLVGTDFINSNQGTLPRCSLFTAACCVCAKPRRRWWRAITSRPTQPNRTSWPSCAPHPNRGCLCC
jgi:hypothetical protein